MWLIALVATSGVALMGRRGGGHHPDGGNPQGPQGGRSAVVKRGAHGLCAFARLHDDGHTMGMFVTIPSTPTPTPPIPPTPPHTSVLLDNVCIQAARANVAKGKEFTQLEAQGNAEHDRYY